MCFFSMLVKWEYHISGMEFETGRLTKAEIIFASLCKRGKLSFLRVEVCCRSKKPCLPMFTLGLVNVRYMEVTDINRS